MSNFLKAASLAVLSAITLGSVAPAAFALENGDPACRNIVGNYVGNYGVKSSSSYNQMPFYKEPGDIAMGKTAPAGAPFGSTVELASPYQETYVNREDGSGVVMVAVKAYGQKLWMPLADGASVGGGDYVVTGDSNLSYCSVQGMW